MTAHPVHHHPLVHRLMAVEHRLRDLLHPPTEILAAAGLREGMTVLDFGCGPGGFSLAAARLVGPGGRVYAVDINPLARESVLRRAEKGWLGSLTVPSETDLAAIGDGEVDLALLYDVLHELEDPADVLGRIRRVLAPTGSLSVRDHRLGREEAVGSVTAGGLFRFVAGEGPLLRFFALQEVSNGDV